jgi:peptidoglycan/LPS O-acetylase OafA/YrhL
VRTIEFEWNRHRGVGPGFDTLRVVLAILVLCTHSFLIVNGNFDYLYASRLWTIFGPVLPMFFALSGFLIAASAQRLTLGPFLLNRSLRIVPALAVDILISALIIGPAVTSVDLSSYLRGKDFHHYFLNIIGFIHYLLPGVFLQNPWPQQVNGSLWTVPFEIGCYALMTLLILTGAIRSRRFMLLAVAIFSLVYYAAKFFLPQSVIYLGTGGGLHNYLSGFVSDRGAVLYFYFVGGVLLYFLRDVIPYSGKLASFCALIVLLSSGDFIQLGAYQPLVTALPVAYLVAYIGLAPIGKLPLFSRGDYSYGIYLYAYPLQQTLVFAFPGHFDVPIHILCSTICVVIVAMCSWHFVEKPFLGLRKKFRFPSRSGEAPAFQKDATVSPSGAKWLEPRLNEQGPS